ncbi:G-type lectin S-receptor-like serine/threonine-protein kinase [Vitis vinifera]|uniref:G-type lectin S-receptor-like serine/threonine-protein kinase n=1 Tax=Vitis vinifera TaxID=29760 RepID=A0A438BPP5_VITVI|nr:G-type lectin S-receptor-like serine/threonine-protein kinase [Vitis vinifera]
MDSLTTVAVIFSYVLSFLRISVAVDTIIVNQNITDGETITSAGGSFELGFFSPGNSKNRYLGIWYKKVATGTVVWVANRESPLTDSSGVLKVTEQGILVLVNGTNGILWNSNSSRSVEDPKAQLLESGNLVVRSGNDSDSENFFWQSF